jgi:hypothetical protein
VAYGKFFIEQSNQFDGGLAGKAIAVKINISAQAI